MPIFQLDKEIVFPSPELANEDGILAVGGDTSPERLLLAYRSGIFPWPHQGMPLLWFSPDPRFVLVPEKLKINRSLKKSIAKNPYRIVFDTNFKLVMQACAKANRPQQAGTWITKDIIYGYTALHGLGFAHSVEAYRDNDLVGGLYGVSLGSVFFGESMFSIAPDASKICFVTLVEHLKQWNFSLIDCQAQTEHLERFGAVHWPRKKFLNLLHESLKVPTMKGPWHLETLARSIVNT